MLSTINPTGTKSGLIPTLSPPLARPEAWNCRWTLCEDRISGWKVQLFGNCICFRSQVSRGGGDTYFFGFLRSFLALSKGPDRVHVSVLSPEDGNRRSSRKAVLSSYLELRTMGKAQNPSGSECHTPSSGPFAFHLYELANMLAMQRDSGCTGTPLEGKSRGGVEGLWR
jgi:hypothetical protein